MRTRVGNTGWTRRGSRRPCRTAQPRFSLRRARDHFKSGHSHRAFAICGARGAAAVGASALGWRAANFGKIRGNHREIEGGLDRVILLLDEAAALPFAVPVKSVRTRILEFCAALD